MKPGGRIVILDYNVEDTRWEPDSPADFNSFFRAGAEKSLRLRTSTTARKPSVDDQRPSFLHRGLINTLSDARHTLIATNKALDTALARAYA